MLQLFKRFEEGDLEDWPLNRFVAARLVTVKLVRSPEQILNKFRELHVRSNVVRKMAHIYIERRVADLCDRPGVLKIHSYMQERDVEASLKRHVDDRVEKYYPSTEYGTAVGQVPPEILEMAKNEEHARSTKSPGPTSNFDMKQATMHDTPNEIANLFENVRPSIVTDEATTADTFSEEVVAEYALKSISALEIHMSNKFENQFVSKYLPRIFPWALNYDCGGPEYPHLFSDWKEMDEGNTEELAGSVQERWRRIADEAPLLDGDYAAMLATRPESQLAGDWMAVPAARNLHWRYAVLHSAFLCCKQKVAPGEP